MALVVLVRAGDRAEGIRTARDAMDAPPPEKHSLTLRMLMDEIAGSSDGAARVTRRVDGFTPARPWRTTAKAALRAVIGSSGSQSRKMRAPTPHPALDQLGPKQATVPDCPTGRSLRAVYGPTIGGLAVKSYPMQSISSR